MHAIIGIDEFKARLGAIRLTAEELSRRAGVANTTVRRVIAGNTKNSWVSTRLKMQRALEDEERRLREHLDQLREGHAA